MLKIQQITNDTKQKQTFNLPNGSAFTMTIYFCPLQYGWFIEEFSYADFSLKGFRISNSYNMLHQFINQLPFGLACIPSKKLNPQKREPMFQDDFSDGVCELYILTNAEKLQYLEILSGEA